MKRQHSRCARILDVTGRVLGIGAGLAAGGYALYAGATWVRYGHVERAAEGAEPDLLMDRLMPRFEVIERHHIAVDAPAEITLRAAMDQELTAIPLVRAVFKARELVMGSTAVDRSLPSGLTAMVLSIGWRIVAETPGREAVFGAVTKPWEANVVFKGLPPQEFAGFQDPGYVKIIWSLRADPIDSSHSMFRTETRVVTTDPAARRRFRLYWAFVSPGVGIIRRMSLRPLKSAAEALYSSNAANLVSQPLGVRGPLPCQDRSPGA